MNLKKYIVKEYRKFKKKSWLGKGGDILFILLILLLLIPSARKELLTYGSKVRMLFAEVDTQKHTELKGKSSLLIMAEDGKQYTLSHFQDKPVFINYWATWCPPCRAEMPSLQTLYNEYQDEIHFLFITSESFDKTNSFLESKEYNFPVYKIKSAPMGNLKYEVLPTSLLLSEDDRIVFKKEGAVDWNREKVKRIFEEVLNS